MSKLNMFLLFLAGFIVRHYTESAIQDWMGLERWVAWERANWVVYSPWLSIIPAVIWLIFPVVIGALELQRQKHENILSFIPRRVVRGNPRNPIGFRKEL